MSDRLAAREPRGSSRLLRPLLWILAIALAGAAVDFLFGVRTAPRGFSPVYLTDFGFPVFACTIALAATALLAGWLLIGWPATRWFDLRVLPTVLAVAAFVGSLGALVGAFDALHAWSVTRSLAEIAPLLPVAVAAAYGTYRLATGTMAERGKAQDHDLWPGIAALTLVLVSVVVWALRYLLAGSGSGLWWLLVVAAVAVLSACLAGSRGARGALLVHGGVLATVAFVAIAHRLPLPDSNLHLAGPSKSGPPRQVLLLTVDTLRADSLSSYAPAGGRTPQIDRLAAAGTLFETATSAGNWTLPGVATILTGLSPSVHEIVAQYLPVADGIDTIAEVMAAEGYRTAGIGGNSHLSSDELKFSQGFERYYFFPMTYGGSFGAKIFNWLVHSDRTTGPSTRLLTDLAIDWLRANRNESFFLWLHYFDPHLGYEPTEEYIGREGLSEEGPAAVSISDMRRVRGGVFVPNAEERARIHGLYNAEVRYVDDSIGRLLDELSELGLYDDMVIVFSSDHGEEIFDHGSLEHGHTVYEEVTAVPLIVKGPAGSGVPEGRRIAEPVGTASIVPTLLELAEVRYDPRRFTASSLVPYARGEKVAEQPVLSHGGRYYEPRVGVRMGRYKYIVGLTSGVEELYDMEIDPKERHSLAAALPEQVARAREIIGEHEAHAELLQKQLGIEISDVELSNETRQQLEALGYLH